MRWLIVFAALCFSSGICPAASPAVTVLSWNMQWFPSGSPKAAPLEKETSRIYEAAMILKGANADIVVVQEIRDGKTAEALVNEMGGGYHVVICSSFRDRFGGAPGWQQIAILSRLPAKAAWSEAWKSFGVVDPPRGFSFASFEIEGVHVAVYGVHLKSNLQDSVEKQHQLNMLKRELAVEQLLVHRRKEDEKAGRPCDVVVVVGDFNTTLNSPRFVSEGAIRKLQENQFTTEYASSNLADQITVPAKGGYPSVTFDYIFQRGGRWVEPVRVLTLDFSDHRPVIGRIGFGSL